MNKSIPFIVGFLLTASAVAGVGYVRWASDASDDAAIARNSQSESDFASGAMAISDPPGDAKDVGATHLTYGPSCIVFCEPIPNAPTQAGPAAAMYDILSTGVSSETRDSFVVQLEIAELAEGFPELRDSAEHRIAEYTVCWTPSPDFARRCVLLNVWPTEDGATLGGSFNIFGAKECNDWRWCVWRIPVEVTYGAPAEIRFTVPKAYVTFDDAPLELAQFYAESGWYSANAALPLWHVAWTVHTNGEHNHDHQGLYEPANIADTTTKTSDSLTLAPLPEVAAVVEARIAPLMEPGAGLLGGGQGIRDYPELDLLAFDLDMQGEELVATYKMARFDAMPDYDIQFATVFGVEGGTTFEVGLMTISGESYGYAGRCVSFGCHDGFLTQVPYEILPGGIIEVRAPRSLWQQLDEGALVNMMLAYTMYGEASYDVGKTGEPVYANVHSGSITDVGLGGLPFVIEPAAMPSEGHGDHTH